MNPTITRWRQSRPLFCLHCGRELALYEGGEDLWCSYGQCGFAEFGAGCIAEGLAVVNLEATVRTEPEFVVQGFICPVCRSALRQQNYRLTCTNCGFRAGNGLLFHLIERCPHLE